jgi:predicted nucleic acid-binding protein
MYLIGSTHPNRPRAKLAIERAVANHERLVTSVEVLQEILHRYVAIDRREAIDPAFKVLLGLVDEVLDLSLEDLLRAKTISLESDGLSARDALHIAVMEHASIGRILSFDRGFDAWTDIERIAP